MTSLVLLRHAKSDWPPGVPDLERPLNRRGRRDAPSVGRVLATRPPLDVVVTSPARRTRQTLEAVLSALPVGLEPIIDPRVYDADVPSLLEVLADVPAAAERVLLVGHNPGIEMLATYLISNTDDHGYRRLLEKYPTSGLAEINLQTAWTDLSANCGELTSFDIPRG